MTSASVTPTLLAGTVPGWIRVKKHQATVNFINSIAPSSQLGWLARTLGANGGTVLAELSLAHYNKLDAGPYVLDAPTPYVRLNNTSYASAYSLSMDYNNVFDSEWTASPLLAMEWHMHGNAPNLQWIEGLKAYSAGMSFTRNGGGISGGINYTTYHGAGLNNPFHDRDNITAAFRAF